MAKPTTDSGLTEPRSSESPTADGTADRWLLISAAVWTVAAVVVGYTTQTFALAFLVWFAGFMIVVELVPPVRLRPTTRRALQVVVLFGYLGFVVATYTILQSWI